MDENRRRLKCRVTYANDVLTSANQIEKSSETSDPGNDADNVACDIFDEEQSGLFLPLPGLFYSQKRNMIIDEDPSEAIEEIESFYCPQCLENYPSSEAAMYKNLCPRLECVKCPLCSAVLNPIVSHVSGHEGPQTYLSCGYCFWDSIGVQLVAPTAVELFNKIMNIEDNFDSTCIVASRIHALRETQQLTERKKMLRDRLKQRSTQSMKTNLLLQLSRLEYGKKRDTYTAWGWQDAVAYEEKKTELEMKRNKEKNNNVSLKIQQYIEEGKSLLSRQKKGKLKGTPEKDGVKGPAKSTNTPLTSEETRSWSRWTLGITMEKNLRSQRSHLKSA